MSAAKIAETNKKIPGRRWGLRLLAFLGGILVLLWAAPIIVGWSPLVAWGCDHAKKYIEGSVTVGSASLGWFSPVVLHNIEIRDGDHRTIAQIPKITSDHSLLKLLFGGDDLGSFRIEKPTLDWKFQGNGSNLERMLAKTLAAMSREQAEHPSVSASPLPHLHLEIVDGTLSIEDSDTKQIWKTQSLMASALVFNDADKTIQLQAQGTLHDGFEAGMVKAEILLQNLAEANPKATIKGRFSSFPLAMLNVLARRHRPGTALRGSLQGHCHLAVSVKDGKPFVDLSGEWTGNHVQVNSPFLAEPLYLEHVTSPCRLKLDDRTLTVDRVEIDTDLGKASVQGTCDLSKDWLAAVDQPAFDLAVDVNLAILAERLPKTLHLHKDLRLTTGQLTLKCKSQSSKEGTLWLVKLHMTDVRGRKGKNAVAWPEPIHLDFQVRNLSKGVPLIDQLKCSSRFLTMEASTTPDQFTLKTEADLQQLAEPLAEFIAQDAAQIVGRANATVTVRRFARDQFTLQGNARLKQVKLQWNSQRRTASESIALTFNAQGKIDPAGQQRIESGNFEAQLGSDLVSVQLLEPIADVAAGPWGALVLRIEGDLARWQERARGWTSLLDDRRLGGRMNAELRLRPARQSVECPSAILEASEFDCTSSNLWIREPKLSVQTSARWDFATDRLELGPTKLICPSLLIEATKLSLHPAARTLRGSAQLTGSLSKLRKWTQAPREKPGDPMEGILAGQLDLEASERRLDADFKGSIKNFLYGTPAGPAWSEPEVKCAVQGHYDSTRDAFELEKLCLVTDMLNASAQGKITHLTSTKDVDFQGTLAYDLEKMEPQLRPLLGKNVKIAGKEARPFHVAGPLYPKSKSKMIAVAVSSPSLASPCLSFIELKGEASLNWKSLKGLGCDVGPAEAKAVLQQGWFQLYPIETSLNEGKLRLQPNVRLEPGTVEMILLAGPVLQRAKLTPEMCAGAMAYAMPLLVNVAEVEGLVSLSLEGGRIPLAAPSTSEIKGTLVLHSAKARPNAIVRELSGLLKMPPPTCLAKECTVPFHMIAGKVHHRDLELAFPEFTIRSSGAVGLDGSLALVVEMPIPPRIAAVAKLTPAQAREKIRIPIGGTLENPRPDARSLEALTSVLGRSLLENQLNKLLQPRP